MESAVKVSGWDTKSLYIACGLAVIKSYIPSVQTYDLIDVCLYSNNCKVCSQ